MWFRFVPWIASLVRRRHISGQTDRAQNTDVSLLFAFVRSVLFVSLYTSHGLEWQVTEFYAIMVAIALHSDADLDRQSLKLTCYVFQKFHFLPHRKHWDITVSIDNAVYWHVTPRNLEETYRSFGRTCCPSLRSRSEFFRSFSEYLYFCFLNCLFARTNMITVSSYR